MSCAATLRGKLNNEIYKLYRLNVTIISNLSLKYSKYSLEYILKRMNYTCIPSSGGINNFARQQRFQPTLHRKYPESLEEILRGNRMCG